MIRPALPADADAIARIYNYYILNTVITFDELVITPQDITRRLDDVYAAYLPWLVAVSSGRIVGYAYAFIWKERSAYRYSVESTVYLDPDTLGVGFGSQLYENLLTNLRQQKLHTVIGGIALPNEASIRLHERYGFRKVAHFKDVGYKFG
jgi:L-amino acid N-acyltransferase YncA